MRKTKPITREKYPEWMEMLRRKYFGTCLIEIARRGNGNQIHYVIGDKYYEKLLWDRDNQINPEDEEFIGSSRMRRL